MEGADEEVRVEIGMRSAEPGRILFGNYAGQVSLRGMLESSAAAG